VSKEFEQRGSDQYGKFFRTINVLRHHQGLRALEEVAGKAALAKHVRTVTVTERHITDIGEQPESDKGILVQASESLPKLASIQIDTFSFSESPRGFLCRGRVTRYTMAITKQTSVVQYTILSSRHSLTLTSTWVSQFTSTSHPQKKHPTGDL
jgi:hypothetical protein